MKERERHDSYCGRILLTHMEVLRKSSEKLISGDPDVEWLHKARVATRRIRSVLELMDGLFSELDLKGWRRKFRELGRGLGEARDLDVRMEFLSDEEKCGYDGTVGIARLSLRLRQRREALNPFLLDVVESSLRWNLWAAVSDRLSPLMGKSYLDDGREDDFPREWIDLALDDRTLRVVGHDAFVRSGYNRDLWHRLRKDGKRLRYTMEIYDPAIGGGFKKSISILKEMQDRLGLIHDLDLWIEWLPIFLEDEKERTRVYFGHLRGFRKIESDVKAFRNSLTDRFSSEKVFFMEWWRGLSEDRFWNGLLGDEI
ncbi:CHAD domain containing protein [Dethiosulfovibrio peptidovorans DSM 11002]|uniref:CHAD domain containing protein n=1 Tax=Dethiosulfovibrio peptidovorans DSM 11002 TaxID=469381 RepID=D2Z4A7_9BACT|nr:CHAD domain-containing protein [Dethiosulfovibrio peptidovorans]EFC90436.1 CHAD domain containing protein [Dethiosulfovibrio peptidovorans DSM 11002]